MARLMSRMREIADMGHVNGLTFLMDIEVLQRLSKNEVLGPEHTIHIERRLRDLVEIKKGQLKRQSAAMEVPEQSYYWWDWSHRQGSAPQWGADSWTW
ncbi:unnamed protein product [Symbiodinium natans]|uniref:Uncharacterized protein n=1 Tax=Symbiodinium natans TaxID=878477 RepID=A0A812PF80_9DINO|nr:unnamed protein product [Symbiodinium natans]